MRDNTTVEGLNVPAYEGKTPSTHLGLSAGTDHMIGSAIVLVGACVDSIDLVMRMKSDHLS